jgi:HTH-type transcriptional regulator/antitoxin HigA
MNKVKDERELLSKPGDVIIETLEHIKMNQTELSIRMGKTPSKISDVISGKEPITVATALQLEKVLGIDAQFWLNRETLYREKLSRIEQEEVLEECLDWLKTQPLKELKKSGYIKSEIVGTDMVDEMLKFYGVISPSQWELVYFERTVSVDYRKSSAHQSALSSMAAWLRMGELAMRKLRLVEYNKDVFKQCLSEIKSLVREHPEDFAEKLHNHCLRAGVAVIYTTCIPKAPISGAVRWIGGNPLIQLSDRYKSNDHFWFTFFHEAGHVLLHGKKDVFIENLPQYELDEMKEDQANEFANKTLLPDDVQDIPKPISEKGIRLFARKYNTHAAIVLGRLQHLDIVGRSFGNSLRLKVTLDHVVNDS